MASVPTTLDETFRELAAANPDKPCLVYDSHTLSVARVDRLSSKMAEKLSAYLAADGNDGRRPPPPTPSFGVMMQPSHKLVTVLLSVVKAGAAYVPIDAKASGELARHILEVSKPVAVIGAVGEMTAETRELIDGRDGCALIDVEALWQQVVEDSSIRGVGDASIDGEASADGGDSSLASSHLGNENETPTRNPDNPACIIFTSGSTGMPKGVPVTHKMILSRLRWQWDTFPYEPNEVCCFKTAYTFVDSVAEIFGPLLRGVKLVVFDRPDVCDPFKFVSKLTLHKVTRLVLVPSLLKAVLTLLESVKKHRNGFSKEFGNLDQLKLWVCSGETLPLKVANNFFRTLSSSSSRINQKQRRILCNFYGSTEVMADVLYHVFQCEEDLMKTGDHELGLPLGQPIGEAQILLLDEEGRQVETGDPGEICVAGTCVASGYLGADSNPNFVRIQHSSGARYMYKTGDLGVMRNGCYYFLGRKDSVVKIRGKKVSLEMVEASLAQMEGISRVVVVCNQDKDGLKSGVVGFYTSSEANLTEEFLHKTVKERRILEDHCIPVFCKVEDIPSLPNGKPDRRSLLQLLRSGAIVAEAGNPAGEESSNNGEETSVIRTYGEDSRENVRVLLAAISEVLGPRAASKATATASLYSIGGSSLSAFQLVNEIMSLSGKNLAMEEFLRCKTLEDVVQLMQNTAVENGKRNGITSDEIYKTYSIELMTEAVMEQPSYYSVGVDSFVRKGHLENLNRHLAPVRKELTHYTKAAVNDGLSVVAVDNATNAIIGLCINADYGKSPDLKVEGVYVPHYSETTLWLREKFWPDVPKEEGKVVMSLWTSVDPELDPATSIEIMLALESASLDLAKGKGYEYAFTGNIHPVAQQISRTLGFEVKGRFFLRDYINPKGEPIYANLPKHIYKEFATKRL